jgi:hypothetical protein
MFPLVIYQYIPDVEIRWKDGDWFLRPLQIAKIKQRPVCSVAPLNSQSFVNFFSRLAKAKEQTSGSQCLHRLEGTIGLERLRLRDYEPLMSAAGLGGWPQRLRQAGAFWGGAV